MAVNKTYITRFAPSPSGRLHIGHAYSALFTYNKAIKNNGYFILRIEDIDQQRCRDEYIDGIYEDLAWLGIKWPEPVRIQSNHMEDYKQALSQLEQKGLIYPCFCSRKDIQEEIKKSGAAPHGPEGILYPGTCRDLTKKEQQDNINSGKPYAMRLNLQKALEYIDYKPLTWIDEEHGEFTAEPETLGDVVLARKDFPTSYHLSVVVDDALQGVSCVTRGQDLLYATHLHRLLQELLDLPVPHYHHHKLLLDETGKRFAKRNQSVTLQHLRESGLTPQDAISQLN